MAIGTRHAPPTSFPTLTSRAGLDPARIEMEEDAKMAATAERMGRLKCVRLGCITLLDPSRTPDGICQFHRRRSS